MKKTCFGRTLGGGLHFNRILLSFIVLVSFFTFQACSNQIFNATEKSGDDTDIPQAEDLENDNFEDADSVEDFPKFPDNIAGREDVTSNEYESNPQIDCGNKDKSTNAAENKIEDLKLCKVLENKLGYLTCSTDIENGLSFNELTIADGITTSVERVGKFIMPVGDNAALPLVFQNANHFRLHYDFLITAFPELYGTLTPEQYESLALNNGERVYYVGSIIKFIERCNGSSYGFTVVQNSDINGPLSPEEILSIQNRLSSHLPGDNKALFFPMTVLDEDVSESYANSGVSVFSCEPPINFEVYTQGVGYGFVKIYGSQNFELASEEGTYGWQDIIVIDGAPINVSSITSGIVTVERQNILSHLNVQTSIRQTPNFFLRNATEELAAYEGRLVRIEVSTSGYTIDDNIDLSEATAWWESNRPVLDDVAIPDFHYRTLPRLSFVNTETELERETAFSRFGGKGANLAILSSVLNPKYMVDGFLIPFAYYKDFMESNTIKLNINGQTQEISYLEYVNYLTTNKEFLADRSVRAQLLGEFSDEIEHSSRISESITTKLIERINTVFNKENTMVRFRSSSNMEDSIEFSGAGLYDSESACATDSLEQPLYGSLCDPDKRESRTIENALRKVWSSFWTSKAFEERYYYQFFDPAKTAMAIAVTPAFLNEAANGVVFSGLPTSTLDNRLLVNVQVGETSVVSPPAGILPESAIVDIEDDHNLVKRISQSSLMPDLSEVLSDEEYLELADVVKGVEEAYPIDYGSYEPEEIILDLEFKIQPDRNIYFKQVRPFRRSPATNPPSEGFPLKVEADLPVCGQFIENRDIMVERELSTKITLTGQDVILPFDGELPIISLIDQVTFGPQKQKLERILDPVWTIEIFTDSQGTSHYLFTYSEVFSKDSIHATISHTFQGSYTADSLTVDGFVINEDSISDLHNDWDMEVSISGENFPIRLSSCSYDNLPTYRRSATILDKYDVSMDVKYYPAMIGTGNASLVSARISFEKASFIIDDYFRLMYSAAHHNWNERLMIAFKKTAQQDLGGVIFEEPYPYESAPVLLHVLNRDMEITETKEVDDYLVEVVE